MSDSDFQTTVLTELGEIKTKLAEQLGEIKAKLAVQQSVLDERCGHRSKEIDNLWQRMGTVKGRLDILEDESQRRRGGIKVWMSISAAVGAIASLAGNFLIRLFMQGGSGQ